MDEFINKNCKDDEPKVLKERLKEFLQNNASIKKNDGTDYTYESKQKKIREFVKEYHD